MPRVEEAEVKQPSEPHEVARQHCRAKQLLHPSATSTAGQLVEESRVGAMEKKAAAEAVVTSSLLAV